jgi:hypothetical protein
MGAAFAGSFRLRDSSPARFEIGEIPHVHSVDERSLCIDVKVAPQVFDLVFLRS